MHGQELATFRKSVVDHACCCDSVHVMTEPFEGGPQEMVLLLTELKISTIQIVLCTYRHHRCDKTLL